VEPTSARAQRAAETGVVGTHLAVRSVVGPLAALVHPEAVSGVLLGSLQLEEP